MLAANWYSLNSTRRYPLEEGVTALDDAGHVFPVDILADCRLQFPDSYGQIAFLAGLTITPRLVTAVFLAAGDTDSVTGFQPLASVNLPQPVRPLVAYPLQALAPGVGGFIVFGDPREPYAGRFSSPAQSRLLLRCASAYPALPIPWLQKLGRDTVLTGLVSLLPSTDLEIVQETRMIDGVEVEALVFRLIPPTRARNVLREYAGPCRGRPESETCPLPAITDINGVTPDCAGNIAIVFEGLEQSSLSSCTGEVWETDIDLEAICDLLPERHRFRGSDSCSSDSSSESSDGSGDGFLAMLGQPIWELPPVVPKSQSPEPRSGQWLLTPEGWLAISGAENLLVLPEKLEPGASFRFRVRFPEQDPPPVAGLCLDCYLAWPTHIVLDFAASQLQLRRGDRVLHRLPVPALQWDQPCEVQVTHQPAGAGQQRGLDDTLICRVGTAACSFPWPGLNANSLGFYARGRAYFEVQP